MSQPYRKGNYWYIKLANGYEIQFVNDKEAWEYYNEYQND